MHQSRLAPLLGQHTDEVLHNWLGYDDGQIEQLHDQRIV
jgi:crotonobetainyl-CoA:carnitine CoA-transferase CaiB-like acyl-CoA transferase